MPSGYEAEKGYEQRIKDTIKTLGKLRAPKLITIARSLGFLDEKGEMEHVFVPPQYQMYVEELTINGLKELYK